MDLKIYYMTTDKLQKEYKVPFGAYPVLLAIVFIIFFILGVGFSIAWLINKI
jgi:putative effector of murein hydrolase